MGDMPTPDLGTGPTAAALVSLQPERETIETLVTIWEFALIAALGLLVLVIGVVVLAPGPAARLRALVVSASEDETRSPWGLVEVLTVVVLGLVIVVPALAIVWIVWWPLLVVVALVGVALLARRVGALDAVRGARGE